MKKIIMLLVFVQLVLLSVFSLNEYNAFKNNQLLYKDTSSITIEIKSQVERGTSLKSFDYLRNLSEKYQVSISKYIFRNEKDLIIYTTDTMLNGQVELEKGAFPSLHSNQFVSMKNRISEDQVGIIKQSEPQLMITIKNLNEANNFGENGIYYIGTTNDVTLKQIVSDLNRDIATAEIFNENNSYMNYTTFGENLLLVVSIGIVALCIFIAFAYYIVDKLKVISILRTVGFSSERVSLYLIRDILKPMLLSTLSAYIVCTTYYWLFYQADYLKELSCIYMLYSFFVVFIYVLFLFLSLCFIVRNSRITVSIKGRKPFAVLAFVNYCLKFIFVGFLLFSINQLLENTSTLEAKLSNLSVWEKTQNVYTTVTTYTGRGNDYELNKKLKNYYIDLEQNHKAFLMNAANYSDTGDGELLYELNTNGEDTLISPSGKMVIINTNYLEYNPIKASTITVEDQIIDNENTLNIFVPNKLKSLEEKIYEKYKRWFYFQKVEVANVYNKEANKKLDSTKLEELSINIIYVKDNQNYFTFSPDIGEENGFLITDPIAIILKQNLADQVYKAFLSSSFYFHSNSADPYSILRPLITKNDVQSSIQRVKPVYNVYGKEIESLQSQKRMNSIIVFILAMSNFIVTFNIVASYYQKNKIKLYIQKLFGYSMLKRNWSMLILLILINVVPILIAVMMYGENLLVYGGLIIGLEILVGIFIDQVIFKKTFNSIIKGER